MSRYKDLTGQRFCRWCVLKEAGRDKNKNVIWKCECDCGTIRSIKTASLRRAYRPSRSCGCLQKETARNRWTTHGQSKSKTYTSWLSMLDRCYNENHKHYSYYGGRGIAVCGRWRGENGFVNFINDMGKRPEGMTIERANNDENYEPDNCRWATRADQAKNKRPRKDRFFSDESVRIIRKTKASVALIASITGVNVRLIYRIRSREAYKHVT